MINSKSYKYKCAVCETYMIYPTKVISDFDRWFKNKSNITYDYIYCDKCHSYGLARDYKSNYNIYPSNMYDFMSNDNVSDNKLQLAKSFIDTYGLNEHTSILDYCGINDEFLRALSIQGVGSEDGHDLVLYEPRYPIKESISKEGIKTQANKITNQLFDFIIMSNAIQLTTDINVTTNNLKSLLKRNGRIYISTPNPQALVFEAFKGHTVDLNAPRNQFIISKEGMDSVMNKNGLKVMAVTYISTIASVLSGIRFEKGLGINDTPLKEEDATMIQNAVGFNNIANRLKRGSFAEYIIKKQEDI